MWPLEYDPSLKKKVVKVTECFKSLLLCYKRACLITKLLVRIVDIHRKTNSRKIKVKFSLYLFKIHLWDGVTRPNEAYLISQNCPTVSLFLCL